MSADLFEELCSGRLATGQPVDATKFIGYSADEIVKIEELYDIRVSGEFRKFILKMGRYGGGAFNNDPIILYRPNFSIRSHVLFQYECFDKMQNIKAYSFLRKPFAFSLENETQYYFLVTGSNEPEIVCQYNRDNETVQSTGLSFAQYITSVLRRYPQCARSDLCRGELLNIAYERIATTGDAARRDVFNMLRSSQPSGGWPVDAAQVCGYSEEEVAKIEALYDIRVQGVFREFMLEMGRCSGGLIGDDPIILYRPAWSVRTQILVQIGLRQNLRDNRLIEIAEKKPFAFSKEGDTQYYFMMTDSDSPDMVYHYDENCGTVRIVGLSFMEYMKDAIRRYLRYGQHVVCRGELLNLT